MTRFLWCTGGSRIFALLVAACACTAVAQTNRQKISEDEARKLVYETLKAHDPHHQVQIPRVENHYDSQFIYFEATWPNPTGSPHLGNFAVNPWTGDVYNEDDCERVTSPSLKKLQDVIRRRSGLSSHDYSSAKAKKPICGND